MNLFAATIEIDAPDERVTLGSKVEPGVSEKNRGPGLKVVEAITLVAPIFELKAAQSITQDDPDARVPVYWIHAPDTESVTRGFVAGPATVITASEIGAVIPAKAARDPVPIEVVRVVAFQSGSGKISSTVKVARVSLSK